MKNRYLVFSPGVIFLSIVFIFSSCKKINEATQLGDELIPAVDNVNTFETIIDALTYNGIFTDASGGPFADSIRMNRTDEHFLGIINNDPLFGKTEASMYFQLKPASFKFSFPFTPDSLLGLDSVVLVLSYHDTYGDSTLAQQVVVQEIDQSNNFKSDSIYLLRKNNFPVLGPTLGPVKTFIPKTLDDSIFMFHENSSNQLRIPLDNTFGERLLNYDTTNAYASDSAFNNYFKGFAVTPQNNGLANAVLGFQLNDTNTKLALYYRYIKNGKFDTVVNYFRLTTSSATANYVTRDYNGSAFASYLPPDSLIDDLLFIQTTPGSFANIRIPGLDTISNKIVHRAELIVEQVYDPSDQEFPPPTKLYLDAYDSVKSKFRIIPYDLAITSSGSLNFAQFGAEGKNTTDGSGNPIKIWKFNISRYIQHVLNKTQKNHLLRLSAPFIIRELYLVGGTTDIEQLFEVNPTIVKGRVRLGGGNHPSQRVRLRIIYSKI